MANETTTTSLNDLVDTMLADAIFQLKRTGVMPDKVRRASLLGFPGKQVNFNKWDALASSDVGSGTEGTDYTTNKQLTTSVVNAAVSEYLIMASITDLSRDSSVEDVDGGAGILLGNAMGAKLDDLLVSLFSGFSQTVAGANTTLLADHVTAATQYLRNAAAPEPYYFVGHPKQIWGPRGLTGILDVSAVGSPARATPSAVQLAERGTIGSWGGFGIDWTPEIDDNVAAGGDAAGGFFSWQALGLADKGLLNFEVERNASLRGYELVVQMLAKEVEIVDTYGVYALSKVD